ncbi:MAG TPA: MFS transporter, partial [Armatimonadota bacterium]|nr:MFS transporter [Armatimonadota bacterium]
WEAQGIKPGLLFTASCMSLIATAMSFAIRGDIMGDLKTQFMLNDTHLGMAAGAWTWGFALAILFGGPLCDLLGMRRILYLAFAGHAVGFLMTIFATGFGMLFAGTLIGGIGNGMVEAAINPLVATLYPDKKTAKLNLLHAWFPGGIVLGGLIAYGLSQVAAPGPAGGIPLIGGTPAWQIKMAILLIPVAIYGILIFPAKFPVTERVAAGVSNREMFREALRPFYLFLLLCMMCTASTELGPNQWITNIMQRTIEGMATAGILVLVFINLVMAVGRCFAGPLERKLSPTGIIMAGSVVAAVGLMLLGMANSMVSAFGAAFVFGMGVCYFWPTMLAITSERFPRGGALLLAMTGAFGNIAVGFTTPAMGKIMDVTGSQQTALQYVAILPVIVLIAFTCIYLNDKAKGGYKAEKLGAE